MASNQGGNKGSKQSGNGSTQASNGSGNKQSASRRGFASMDPQRQREIAAEGGRAAHASGNAHEFTSEEARRAGKLSHSGGNRQSGPDTADSSGGRGGSGGSTR